MTKTDCYWYGEERDMNARIPYCKLDPADPYVQVMKCDSCKEYHSKWRPTNADKVRAMNDDELAEVISNLGDCDTCYLYHRGCSMNISCKDAVLEWLKQEAK